MNKTYRKTYKFEPINSTDLYKLSCKLQNKWGVYIHLDDAELEIWKEHSKFFEENNIDTLQLDNYIVFFDKESEAKDFFSVFNKEPFESSTLFAMVINNDGVVVDENT